MCVLFTKTEKKYKRGIEKVGLGSISFASKQNLEAICLLFRVISNSERQTGGHSIFGGRPLWLPVHIFPRVMEKEGGHMTPRETKLLPN